ncbi:hypothetical protein [Streptomyces sp. NPDC048639]|uniref:hypothetical protein n=1 Tax=Streptomyces sp. NPDC048639 TaxID=3365581 RepID=UPI0037141BD5
MDASRAVVAAAVAVAAAGLPVLGLSASPAAAETGRRPGPGDIVVSPRTVKQGDTVTITVGGRSCRGTGRAYDAIVESNAFPRTRLTGQRGSSSSVARPRIFKAVEPGPHTVAATCGGWTVTGGRFRVEPRDGGRTAEDRAAGGGAEREKAGQKAGRPGKAGKADGAKKHGTAADRAAKEREARKDGRGTKAGAADARATAGAARGSADTVVPPHGVATAAPPPVQSAPAIPQRPVRGGIGGGSQRVPPVTVALGVGLVAGSLAAGGYYLIRRRPSDLTS